MKTLAQRLKEARDLKCWTQSQLAVAADVSTGTIGNIESGLRKSKGSIPQIADALGVSYLGLQNGEGDMILYGDNAQTYKENHHVAPVQQALPATNNVASLDATLDNLTAYLAQVEPGRRESVVTLMASLVRTPDDSGLKDALTALLTPSGFASQLQKVA